MAKDTPAKKENHPNDVIVRDLRIYVKGKEFIVKGMAYNPTPLGLQDMNEEGYEGTGYCSAKQTIFNEWRSACFGSDYFDSVKASPNRDPPGPSDGWWVSTWERDFPIMKKLGVNTVRIYNINPYTKTLLKNDPNFVKDIKNPDNAAEHRLFLDYCEKFGFKAIVPIVTDEAFLTGSSDEKIKRVIDAHVEELGDHKALLMWSLGNELDLYKKKNLRDIVNKYMDYVRESMEKQWKRTVPVTTALVDLPEQYEFLAKELRVDVFTSNAGYRGTNFMPLWEGENNNIGWKKLSEKYRLPLLIGEIGYHTEEGQNINEEIPDWFNRQYNQVIKNVENGCIGAVFFEYNDEPTKPKEQRKMGCVEFVENEVGGSSSIDKDAFILDNVVEKDIIFNAIEKGHPNSVYEKFNFNYDEYELIGREQTSIKMNVTIPDDDSSGGDGGNEDDEDSEGDGDNENSASKYKYHTNAVLLLMILILSFICAMY